MATPLISAYVPCFNNAATIRRAVGSLLGQTLRPAEIIVVDDGSVDGSAEALQALDVRIVRHPHNLGRGEVRARAMHEAAHELVLCCDATNTLEPTFVERALPWFQSDHIAAVVGRITQIPARNVVERWRGRHLFKVDLPPEVGHRVSLSTGGAMVRASSVRAVGGYDPKLRHTEDRDLGARLLAGQFEVVRDARLQVISIASNTLRQVLERYWRWYAGADEAVCWRGYWKAIGYSIKAMAVADLRAGDPLSVPISLLTPHYQFWPSRLHQCSARRAKGRPPAVMLSAGIEDPQMVESARRNAQAAPSISVVVPTCRRPNALAALLTCLCQQRRVARTSYEVIVSDDDPSSAGAERVRKQFPEVRYIAGPQRGPAANRNRGASCALGEWIVFIDDDCVPIDTWLNTLLECARQEAAEVIEGRIVVPDKVVSIFRRDVENLTGGCYWSANLAVRRDLFERLRGFDEDFGQAGGEDMEFAYRLQTCGARMRFCEDAMIYHPSHLMTWSNVIEYAFRIRWHALYQLKTRQALPLGTPLWMAVGWVTMSRIWDQLRITWRSLRWSRPGHRLSTLPQIGLSWGPFPVLLPYIVYWDLRFRRMLRLKASQSGIDSAAAPSVMV